MKTPDEIARDLVAHSVFWSDQRRADAIAAALTAEREAREKAEYLTSLHRDEMEQQLEKVRAAEARAEKAEAERDEQAKLKWEAYDANKREREAREKAERNLANRDKFIVDRGLWSDFVATLEADSETAG